MTWCVSYTNKMIYIKKTNKQKNLSLKYKTTTTKRQILKKK